jgi:ribosomal protein S18 acetylase RimI-like enzyme
LRVRPAARGDLPDVVRVHQAAFPGFYMTRLGPPFLRLYYRLVMDYAGGILLVAERAGRVSGFVSGFARPAGFYRLLRKNRPRVALSVLPALLRSPGLAKRLVTNAGRVEDSAREEDGGACELSSIGVMPGTRGLGSALVAAFVADAQARGAREVYLTTDALDNDRVNEFYRRCGFRLERVTEPVAGRPMNLYAVSLPTPAQAAGS